MGGNQNKHHAQDAKQRRIKGVGQEYQNPNQRINQNVSKGGMTNEGLSQKNMFEIGTKINANIDNQDENIRNIHMSELSLD